MKPSKKQLIVLAALAIILAISFAYAADARKPLEVSYPTLPGNPPLTLTPDTTLPQLLQYLFTFFVVIGGLIAFGSMVYAGFLFMTSGANPGLRAKAMGRIRQAMLGLVLLLSAYVILNTLNPELVFLREPGRDLKIPKFTGSGDLTSIFDEIDYASLRYGGVVVFDEPDTSGAKGRSETIFHDIENFEKSTYINKNSGNGAISAVKVLGDCKVSLGAASGPGTVVIPVQDPFVTLSGGLNDFNNNVKSLSFVKKECLGNSIKVFQDLNYNKGTPTSPREGPQGAHTLLTNASNLGTMFFSRDFSPSMNNKISSILLTPDVVLAGPAIPARIELCNEAGYQKPCASLANSSSTLSAQFDNKASSIRFLSGLSRQAGVIVYKDANFGGVHEIFIASDANLTPSILGKSGEISSLQIIGNYRVTFYEKPTFDTLGAWIAFDNTGAQDTKETSSFRPTGTHRRPENSIFSIPDLGVLCSLDGKFCFGDKISSIKIEIRTDSSIYEKQFSSTCQSKRIIDNFCEL